MEMKKMVFDNYQNAIDFCYKHDIPLKNIEKYSSPKDLIWRYTVYFF